MSSGIESRQSARPRLWPWVLLTLALAVPLVIGLGEGEDVLRGLLEAVATSPADYFFAPDGEDLAAIYRLVAGRIQECPKPTPTPRPAIR